MVSKENVICPHCKKEHNKHKVIGTSGLINYYGSTFSMTCDKCGKDFYGEYTVEIKYRTRKTY